MKQRISPLKKMLSEDAPGKILCNIWLDLMHWISYLKSCELRLSCLGNSVSDLVKDNWVYREASL